MPNYTVSLYLGSSEEGKKLLKKLEAHCEKEKLSVSEYIKSLILKDLNNPGGPTHENDPSETD